MMEMGFLEKLFLFIHSLHGLHKYDAVFRNLKQDRRRMRIDDHLA